MINLIRDLPGKPKAIGGEQNGLNPFPTNPSVVVCGMGGGRLGPPIISQPLKGLEG